MNKITKQSKHKYFNRTPHPWKIHLALVTGDTNRITNRFNTKGEGHLSPNYVMWLISVIQQDSHMIIHCTKKTAMKMDYWFCGWLHSLRAIRNKSQIYVILLLCIWIKFVYYYYYCMLLLKLISGKSLFSLKCIFSL